MSKFIVYIITLYQRSISPDHGALFVVLRAVAPRTFNQLRCRFFPSCSEYTKHAVLHYGLLDGSVLSIKRLARCVPWHRGGYDPAALTPKSKT